MSIFVSMAGYEENYILHTIKSALDGADCPDEISFGVSEHRTDGKFYQNVYSNVRLNQEEVSGPLGLSINRNSALALYDGEDYILNIDPHLDFNKGWDTLLIEEYERAFSDIGPKCLMTFFLPSARVSGDKLVQSSEQTHTTPVTYNSNGKMTFRPFTKEEKEKGYAIHYGFCGHNQFGRADVILDFTFDPEVFFFGEEQIMAMRYGTRGYKMFVPDTRCYASHLDKSTFIVGQNYYADALYKAGRKIDDYSKIYDLFMGNYFGHWGAPDQESLDNYLADSGFNYKKFLYLE